MLPLLLFKPGRHRDLALYASLGPDPPQNGARSVLQTETPRATGTLFLRSTRRLDALHYFIRWPTVPLHELVWERRMCTHPVGGMCPDPRDDTTLRGDSLWW